MSSEFSLSVRNLLLAMTVFFLVGGFAAGPLAAPSSADPREDVNWFLLAAGGIYDDQIHDMVLDIYGGVIVAGETESFGSGRDVMVAKYDVDGIWEWSRVAGGGLNESGNAIIITSDGGYLVAGSTTSFGSGSDDVLLIKFDSAYQYQWARVFGGIYRDIAYDVCETSAGNYAVTGVMDKRGGSEPDAGDLFLSVFDASGNLVWARTAGGDAFDIGYSVTEASDGGYVVAGETLSFAEYGTELWLVKFGEDGALHRSRTWEWGVMTGLSARKIQPTTDGGYVAVGQGEELLDDASGLLLAKFSADLTLEWARAHGRSSSDLGGAGLSLTADGGYLASGYDGNDALVIKCDDSGYREWACRVGDSDDEVAHAVLQLPSGEFMAAGESRSFGAGGLDSLLCKLSTFGTLPDCPAVDSRNLQQVTPVFGMKVQHQISSTWDPAISSPEVPTSPQVIPNEDVCRLAASGTLAVSLTCTPESGTLPFTSIFSSSMTNLYPDQFRRAAAHLDATLANGLSIPNWRSGYRNLAPGESYELSWPLYLPALGTLVGNNLFQLFGQDVTPVPYNQPPYPMSGDTDTDFCVIVGNAP